VEVQVALVVRAALVAMVLEVVPEGELVLVGMMALVGKMALEAVEEEPLSDPGVEEALMVLKVLSRTVVLSLWTLFQTVGS
jgi:hypothetical protein